MAGEVLLKSIIPSFKQSMSINPRVAKIQEKIVDLLNPNWPIWRHHHIKALWHRKRIDQVLNGKPNEVMPVTVEFVPSLDCNLSCGACTYRSWKEKTIDQAGKRKMSYEVMMTLLDKIDKAGVSGVIVTGGGEPFANPHLIEGLEYAGQKSFEVGLFSNGSLLNQEKIERLAQTSIGFMRVSFNSADQENYLKFHGIKTPRVFQAAKRNIRLLAKALAGTDINFGLGVIINEVNVGFMHTVAEFVRQLYEERGETNLSYIAYRPVVNYGQIFADLSRQISPAVAKKAIANFESVKTILEGLPVVAILAEDYFADASQGKIGLEREYQGCLGHAWAGSIAYDGGLYLCSEKDGNPRFLMGNLLHQSWEEIWGSEQRRQVLSRIDLCPPACKIHRTNLLLSILISEGKLLGTEIEELQNFMDRIRALGDPGGTDFI